MRVGVFGGTFDPPHVGHLIVAQDALESLALDRVLFVPARTPPHKREGSWSPAETRLAMVRAAVAGDPRFVADDLELGREGPSYTVDTLRALREREGDDVELFLLVGADQFREFATWREPAEVARLATIVVLPRAGSAEGGAGPGGDAGPEAGDAGLGAVAGSGAGGAGAAAVDAARVRHVDATRIDVSSTDLRRRVGQGRTIRYLVPEAVRQIVEREGLYRRGG